MPKERTQPPRPFRELPANSLNERSFLVVLALAVTLQLAWLPNVTDAGEVVLAQGVLEGTVQDGVEVYRGIRYAQAPVGELRWRLPQPLPESDAAVSAEAFGAACLQPARRDRPGNFGPTDEDCLFLNVWTPTDKGPHAVMVWIHGGAFRLGAGSGPFFDGVRFAQNGVVLVTINYRLGRFGFFAHPSLEEGGNFSLMDQVAALEWVRDNIAAFGGDPKNVTIFGESAGGSSVLHLLASPKAKGLFHKAISQSGGGHQIDRHLTATRLGRPSLTDEGVAWQSEETALKTLRSLDAKTVLGAGVISGGVGATAPVIDGTIVPNDPGHLIANGDFNKVPVLIGANSHEASVLAAFGVTAEQAVQIARVDPERLLELYPGEGRAAEVWGDGTFVAGARHVARSVTLHGQAAYLYHFDYVLERRRGRVPGANHGSDVIFVFNSLDALPMSGRLVTDVDRRMAETVQRYWVQFAKTGDPNRPGLPEWPRYDLARDPLLYLGAEIRVEEGFKSAQLDFHQKRWEARERLAGN